MIPGVLTEWRERTCDQCAEKRRCSVIGDCYICEACQAFHNAAIDAATDKAIKDFDMFCNRSLLREIVAVAVKAYCVYAPADGGDDTDAERNC